MSFVLFVAFWGFRVESLWFRVLGSLGLGLRVYGLGLRGFWGSNCNLGYIS